MTAPLLRGAYRRDRRRRRRRRAHPTTVRSRLPQRLLLEVGEIERERLPVLYESQDAWLAKNLGFTIGDVIGVGQAVTNLHTQH